LTLIDLDWASGPFGNTRKYPDLAGFTRNAGVGSPNELNRKKRALPASKRYGRGITERGAPISVSSVGFCSMAKAPPGRSAFFQSPDIFILFSEGRIRFVAC
jgi:hypothetical protein